MPLRYAGTKAKSLFVLLLASTTANERTYKHIYITYINAHVYVRSQQPIFEMVCSLTEMPTDEA
jgi:hypothetical protein